MMMGLFTRRNAGHCMTGLTDDLRAAEADRSIPSTAHARVRAMLDHWIALHPGAGMIPGRQHLDPMRIPTLLPDLWLIDVVDAAGGPRFRYRLQGTRLVDVTGLNAQGRWFDDVNPRFPGGETEAAFLRCIARRAPDWRRGPPKLDHMKKFSELERLFLPLARDGIHPDMILAISVFYDLQGDGVRV
jgi:hypothetical protein